MPTRAGSGLSALCFSSQQPPGTRGGEQAALSRLPGSVISEAAQVRVKGPPTLLLSLPEPRMPGTCWLPDVGKQFTFFSVHRQNSSGSGEHWPQLENEESEAGGPGSEARAGQPHSRRSLHPAWLLPEPSRQAFPGSARLRSTAGQAGRQGTGPQSSASWSLPPGAAGKDRRGRWQGVRLTCSCSSASRVARSSSESELAESEELSSLLRLLSVPLLTTGAAGAGSAGASAGSSGILANRISNTSCERAGAA